MHTSEEKERHTCIHSIMRLLTRLEVDETKCQECPVLRSKHCQMWDKHCEGPEEICESPCEEIWDWHCCIADNSIVYSHSRWDTGVLCNVAWCYTQTLMECVGTMLKCWRVERGNSDILYDPCCSRGNLPEWMDMGHCIALPFLLHFSHDGDLFWCEVLVWCSSASRHQEKPLMP